jgi:BlaR1 peptidase M56
MNYLLKSTVCITIFYGLYYLIFRRLTFVRLNRIYLLSSLAIGLSLPLVSYQIEEVVKIPAKVEYEETTSIPIVLNSSTPLLSKELIEKPFDSNMVLQGIYVLGILFMFFRLIYSFRSIAKEIIHKSINPNGATLRNPNSDGKKFISTQSQYANSSFFNLIFIDDSNLSEQEINQILEHEKWHIRLFHSYDLLFVEILKIIFWFNPILWLYQRSLSEVHEYEVDTRMIQTHNPQLYAYLLLKLASGRDSATTTQLALTHQFSHKPLTDRIHFLFTKQKSVPMKRLAYLSVLPILGAFFMAFSVEKVVDYQVVEESSKYFKIVKNLDYDGFPDISVKENKVISTLYLNKGKIAFVINPNKVSEETVNDAAKYFKGYGFTLKILRKRFDAKKKELAKMEISLTEDENNKKQRLKNKVSAKTDLPEKFNFDLVKMRTTTGKGLDGIITILAVKSSGLHFVSPLAPPPPPPPPLPPPPPPAPPKE